MSEEQRKRYDVVRKVEAGQMTLRSGATVLGRSERQVRRLCQKYRKHGAGGLLHGNTGRRPANCLPDVMYAKVVRLARVKYAGFNDTHLTEKLGEEEHLDLSRSSVRRVLRSAGLASVRRRRPPKHRRRRERKPQAGLLLLWDGSRHEWLEKRGPRLCLVGAMDDATGELLPGVCFVEQECSAAYLQVLAAVVEAKGIPHSVYMDRHGIFKRNDDQWTVEEELRGEQDPTQVGRALQALAIEPIYALSPQAKGRVERLWETLQDRLCSELRLAKACTCAQANAVLRRYRPVFNRRFAVPPREARSAWRSRGQVDLRRVCSFYYTATVLNDNTVHLQGQIIDIPPGPYGRGYAQARVEVRQFLDGSWAVYYHDQLIASTMASALEELKPRRRRKRSATTEAFRRAVQRVAAALP